MILKYFKTISSIHSYQYHDIPWYTMIYHDIPWYTMINHDKPWYWKSLWSSTGPGFILRHKIAGLARSYSDLLKPSRSLITASSLQNSSSPISSAEVRRKPRCREFCREFPHQKWTKTKVVFIILRGMGVIWKSDLTCLNYSQVISCDITVAIFYHIH